MCIVNGHKHNTMMDKVCSDWERVAGGHVFLGSHATMLRLDSTSQWMELARLRWTRMLTPSLRRAVFWSCLSGMAIIPTCFDWTPLAQWLEFAISWGVQRFL